MKIILTFVFIMVLGINLSARMNPFEATDTFNEKKEAYIHNERKKQAQEIKILEDQRLAQLALIEKEDALRAEEEKKAALMKQKKLEKLKKKEIQKKPTYTEVFDLLSFAKIEIIDDTLYIKVDTKYKLVNQDILEKSNKFLFDFSGDLSFYTVRGEIKHKDFKSFAIGTHQEKKFFRVVIEPTNKILKYKEHIDAKKGIVRIVVKQ